MDKNLQSDLVEQVEDLGEDVEASPGVYGGLVEKPRLEMKQKFSFNKNYFSFPTAKIQ